MGMLVEKEKIGSQVSWSVLVTAYMLVSSCIFWINFINSKNVRWFNFWTKCLTIFKIQISLTLLIMKETLPPVYFLFHCKKTSNGSSVKFRKNVSNFYSFKWSTIFFRKANYFCIWPYCSHRLHIFLYHKLFISLNQRVADNCFCYYC